MEKNSVRNLQYGPKTRLIRGIYLSDICFSEGKRHDSGMLADSGLLQDLEAYAFSPAGLPMCIYGDPAYPLRVHLQGPFRDPHLTPLMEAFST